MDTAGCPPSQPTALYAPLRGLDEIRLLFLQPLDNDGKVTCKIQHAKLSSKPQYEALSYCWGVTTTATISIEGQDAEIRTNLWAALKQLSPKDGARCLWIDAVCINQGDTEERNKQVAQMGKIYGQAVGVIVWLGPGSEDSPLAFRLLLAPSAWPKFWKSTDEDLVNAGVEPQLQAFMDLCDREYWHRLWIVQEIFLAQKISIYCGSDCTTWLRLSWFLCSFPNQAEAAQDKPSLAPKLESFDQGIKSSIPWRFFSHHRRTSARGLNSIGPKPKAAVPPPPLHHLCIEYGEARCEDPRDKVYGLHGLAAECCRSQVTVDYSVKQPEIWTKMLTHIVFVRHSLGAYEGTEGLVREIQFLHKGLNVSPKAYREYIQPLIASEKSSASPPVRKEDNIIMEGRARGVITYISPPLDHPLPADASTSFPKFTAWNADEITYIYNRLPEQQSDLPVPIITSAFDVVKPIITPHTSTLGTTSHNFASTSTYLDYSTLWKPQPISSTQEELASRFAAILASAQSSIPRPYASSTRLAIEQNGMICFVPATTEIGDMILQFRGCAVLGIIRTEAAAGRSGFSSSWRKQCPSVLETMPADPRFRIVGRAVNFVNARDTMLYDAAGADLSKHWARFNGRRMDFKADYTAVRDLTVESELGGVV